MIRVFRLCKTKHVATAFSGEGARMMGGRWNSAGIPVVYTSSSLSLATLEVLVHLEDPEVFAKLFSWIPAEIPEHLVKYASPSELRPGWDDDESNINSRSTGDAWLRSEATAVLAVPSVITPGEWNYLINPLHRGFFEIIIGTAQPFRPDRRLIF